jgi:hypothetical protein
MSDVLYRQSLALKDMAQVTGTTSAGYLGTMSVRIGTTDHSPWYLVVERSPPARTGKFMFRKIQRPTATSTQIDTSVEKLTIPTAEGRLRTAIYHYLLFLRRQFSISHRKDLLSGSFIMISR